MHRLLIAGTHSGCGKTTVTCGIMAALKARNRRVAGFKCGPDYIDAMFHREALGIPSHNLDPFFCSETQLRAMLARQEGDIAVIEGVMGYYDGIGPEGLASTYQVARRTQTPTVLVMDVNGMYNSAGAILRGFRDFKPESQIRGVIFNNASAHLYQGLSRLAQEQGLLPLGFLAYGDQVSIGSRHLGLITAGEISDIREKVARLGEMAEQTLNIEGLLALAAEAVPLPPAENQLRPLARARVAVARDSAFCFLYQENLEVLEALGAELAPFSPLADRALPDNIQALYLPGGYPELHLRQLSGNTAMRRCIREAVNSRLPTIAECGGFLYLHDTLYGYPMAGVLPVKADRTAKLQRFGYATITAQKDNLICPAGDSLPVHEFHYYESEDPGRDFQARRPADGQTWPCVHANATLYAGFPHLYFYGKPALAEAFMRKAAAYAAL